MYVATYRLPAHEIIFMPKFLRPALLCLSLGVLLPALAAPVPNLYEVREPMADGERDEAMQRALATLVLRLTGDRKAIDNPALANIRKDPQQIASQFGQQGEHLIVDFDPQSTDQALRDAGLSVWGNNRPSVLVWWLAQDSNGEVQLTGESQTGSEALQQAAQNRGLPLRLPLADLEEQIGVDKPAIAGETDSLATLSERYDADARLAVLASQKDASWEGNWKLVMGDTRESGKASGKTQEALADAILLAVSQKLAPRFAVSRESGQAIQLVIEQVDFARYAEIERMMQPLGARMVSMGNDELKYTVNASSEQIAAQLELLGIHPVETSQPGSTELRFR